MGNSQANGGTVKWTFKIKTAPPQFSLKNLAIFMALRNCPERNIPKHNNAETRKNPKH